MLLCIKGVPVRWIVGWRIDPAADEPGSAPTDGRGLSIAVAALGDIVRAKELVGRAKDPDALPELRQLHDERSDAR